MATIVFGRSQKLDGHPVGNPFFAGPRPPLRLVASDRIGPVALRLTCVPA